MKVKKFELGTIEYRMPNVPETIRFMGALGAKTDGSFDSGEASEFGLFSKIMESIGPFITKIDCTTKAGEKVTDYQTLLQHVDFLTPISEISSEYLELFGAFGDDKKKAVRKTAKKTTRKKVKRKSSRK